MNGKSGLKAIVFLGIIISFFLNGTSRFSFAADKTSPALNYEKIQLWQNGESTAIKLIDGTAVKYSSSDEEVAKVSKKGEVTPLNAGIAMITVTDTEGKQYCCKVTVATTGLWYIPISETKCSVSLNEVTLLDSGHYSYGAKIMKDPVVVIGEKAPDGRTITRIWESSNNKKLRKVILPDSITEIARYCFYNCTNLEYVEIPNGLKKIGANAFEFCLKLKSIDIPDSVTSIGEEAFDNCFSLEYVKLSDSVTTIKDDIFYGCGSLREIVVSPKLKKIDGTIFISGHTGFKTRLIKVNTDKVSKRVVKVLKNAGYYRTSDYLSSRPNNEFTTTSNIQILKALEDMNIDESDSVFEKVKKVHDWMVFNIDYDNFWLHAVSKKDPSYTEEQVKEASKHNPDSVGWILKNRLAVCEGYSRLFEFFMDELGIKCELVESQEMNHSWNMVKMDDGKWYHVDVTWDDHVNVEWDKLDDPEEWVSFFSYDTDCFLRNDKGISSTRHYKWEELHKANGKKYEKEIDRENDTINKFEVYNQRKCTKEEVEEMFGIKISKPLEFK